MNKTQSVLHEIFTQLDVSDLAPSELVNEAWQYYIKNFKTSNTLNGNVFEGIIMMALARENISPIYDQAELTYVDNAIFDVFLYNKKTPYVLSLKTSLRERWKQADFEALALKQVHKKAKNYVITLNKEEVDRRRSHTENYVGIDGFILADTDEFDDLVSELRKINFTVAETIPIIKNDKSSHTYQTLKNLYNLT